MKIKYILVTVLLFNTIITHATLPVPEVKKINERIYALLGPTGMPSRENKGYMVNSTIIIGDRGVILIDTGFTDIIGRHIKKTIAGITAKPVTHVINTHHHGDHSLGNSEFKGAEIISSEKCRELVAKTGYEWIGIVETMTGQKFPNTRPVQASRVYKQNTKNKISLQGIDMELWAPAGSHTAGDLMVYLPEDRVLITGDIVVNTMIPSMRDAHVKTWISTLEDISKMSAVTIVPGHGTLMNSEDVSKLHGMLAGFYAKVEAGYRQGLMDSEIRKILDLTEWKKLKDFDALMGTNINRAYLEVEAENF